MTYEKQKELFQDRWDVAVIEDMTYDKYHYITAGIPTEYTPIAYFKSEIVYRNIYAYYDQKFVDDFMELAKKYKETLDTQNELIENLYTDKKK